MGAGGTDVAPVHISKHREDMTIFSLKKKKHKEESVS